MVFLQKIGLAVGLFLVGLTLDQAGFMETVPGQPSPVQPPSALLAIRLAIGPLPTIALICGLIEPVSQELTDLDLLSLGTGLTSIVTDSSCGTKLESRFHKSRILMIIANKSLIITSTPGIVVAVEECFERNIGSVTVTPSH